MKKEKPLILITNDDGITAPGLQALTEAMSELGDIVVVAPDSPQSGMGHAITINNLLRLDAVRVHDNQKWYQCSGTPVDCVKIAIDKILPRTPDLCVSGVNHGSNSSINVIYSGTMSAAMEGAIEGIPSIGFSLLNFSLDADFTGAKQTVHKIVSSILNKKMDKHFLLNVNIPKLPAEKIKGIKVCKQAYAKYEEDFAERVDPHGKKYYWLTGEFKNFDKGKDTDVWALEHGYVSVVPVQFDLTNYTLKKQLEKSNLFK